MLGYDQRSAEELWPYKCPDCFQLYAHRWDMLKHHRTSHPKKLMPQGPTRTVSFDVWLVFNTLGSVLPCKIVCLWFCLCRCTETTQRLYMVPVQLNTSLSCTFICFYIMSPALLCKSIIQSGNAEECALALPIFLSSSCTHYFVPFHTYICADCKCISLVV